MLTFKEFKKHIQAVKTQTEFQDRLFQLTCDYNKKSKDECTIWFPSLACNVIELLEREMGDDSGMISYWVWELEFGKRYKPGCVADEDGNAINIETVVDLYRYLRQ